MNRDALRSELLLYVLGQSELVAQEVLDRLANQDPEALQALAEAETDLASLPDSLPPIPPSRQLKQRLLQELPTQKQPNDTSPHSPQPPDLSDPQEQQSQDQPSQDQPSQDQPSGASKGGLSRRWLGLPLTVLAVALVGYLVSWWVLSELQLRQNAQRTIDELTDRLDQQGDRLEEVAAELGEVRQQFQETSDQLQDERQEAQQLRLQLQQQYRQLADLKAFIIFALRPGVRSTDLAGGEDYLDAQARLYFDPTTKEIALIASGLKPLQPTKSYELWLVTQGNQAVSLGVLPPDQLGQPLLRRVVEEIPAELKLAAISIEPVGGSPQAGPTGPIVLSGAVK